MALKMRLRRMGRKKAPHYRIVIAESSNARDGRFVANIGHYNPTTEPMTLVVDRDKALFWLARGATPTDTVQSLLKKGGVFNPAPEGVVENVTAAASDAAKGAGRAVKNAAGAVSGAASAAAGAVTGAVSGAASSAADAVSGVASSAAGAVTGAASSAADAVTGAASAAAEAVSDAASSVLDTVRNAVESVTGGGDDAPAAETGADATEEKAG